ncbi:Urease accessory protein UreD [Ancylobacter novellus DSM 506]|uniref:Urease accessory protein UreD n=1 Tax=Ancylobacter novellus (strain ATCC 8093 / DSM 506 / JCM 20403 / CCM 1077 / IAM 12100 / NBRC 12443 / NCIMB 10456) TaxID=639283 RepID=D7A8Z3_ANCN5|nr:urease accessory protein UreD [Ancylobacter novellus]ADH88698.1 Urease accessory protein UreD [Ancylobacter novellus DSM 506]
MYATALPSDAVPATIPVERRGSGRVLVEVRGDGGRTVRGRIEEEGFARVRFPLSGRRGGALEAVMINTGGGLAGGDRSQTVLHALEAAQFVVTTQAAEKVYRSDGAVSGIDVDLSVAAGASLDWMPQATIVFDGARIERSISAEVAPQGRLLLVEPVILGRTARGERLSHGLLFDRWRIRRGGRLVYADGLQLDGDIAGVLDRRATLGGWAAFATILLVAPDAEGRLEAVRAALGLPDELPENLDAGASAWDGMLSIRLLARDGAPLEAAIRRVVGALGIAEIPRIWHS